MNIKLTNAGIALVQKGELGTKGVYTKIVLGDGYLANGQTLVNSAQVNNPVLNITDLILESDEEKVVVKGSFINESEFYLREIGLYTRDTELGEVLCAYGNDGDEAKLVAVSDMERPIRIRQLYNNALSEFEETIFATLEDLASKVDKIDGMGLSSNDYTAEDLEKLAGIEEEANNYVHPETHLASMIEQDEEHRFVSEEEKDAWNAILNAGEGNAEEVAEALNNHESNAIIHTTAVEKAKWDTVGIVANLNTSIKTDTVSAINELKQDVNSIANKPIVEHEFLDYTSSYFTLANSTDFVEITRFNFVAKANEDIAVNVNIQMQASSTGTTSGNLNANSPGRVIVQSNSNQIQLTRRLVQSSNTGSASKSITSVLAFTLNLKNIQKNEPITVILQAATGSAGTNNYTHVYGYDISLIHFPI